MSIIGCIVKVRIEEKEYLTEKQADYIFNTQVCFKNSEDPSRKQTICECTFVTTIIVDIHGNGFEVYTLVSEIHENVELVLGIKNVFKLQGVINS